MKTRKPYQSITEGKTLIPVEEICKRDAIVVDQVDFFRAKKDNKPMMPCCLSGEDAFFFAPKWLMQSISAIADDVGGYAELNRQLANDPFVLRGHRETRTSKNGKSFSVYVFDDVDTDEK